MADRNKVIERIKKLLNVTTANNATEAEAIAAALAAQKLMAENNVEEWELAGEGEPIESVGVKRTRQWQNTLAQIIADNFRCKFYLGSRGYGSMYHRPRPELMFYGYKSDATAAALTFTHLSKIANRLGNKYCEGLPTQNDYRLSVFNEWVMGFCDGVRKELEKQSVALMIICPPKVNEAYEVLSADFEQVTTKFPTSRDAKAHDEGMSAGRDAVRAGRVEGGKKDYILDGAD